MSLSLDLGSEHCRIIKNNWGKNSDKKREKKKREGARMTLLIQEASALIPSVLTLAGK